MINKLIKRLFIEELTDVQVSKEVEEKILKNGFGQRFVLAFDKIPLFFRNNIFAIQDRVLKNSGSLEIITKGTYNLNKLPLQFKGNVEIYQNTEDLKLEFAVFYNNYLVMPYNENKNTFFLYNSFKVARSYLGRFDRMKKPLSMIRQEKLTPTTFINPKF